MVAHMTPSQCSPQSERQASYLKLACFLNGYDAFRADTRGKIEVDNIDFNGALSNRQSKRGETESDTLTNTTSTTPVFNNNNNNKLGLDRNEVINESAETKVVQVDQSLETMPTNDAAILTNVTLAKKENNVNEPASDVKLVQVNF